MSSIEDVLNAIAGLSAKIDRLESKFDLYEPLFTDTYELVVRRELKEIKGLDYARAFNVVDLHGLARISFPKNVKIKNKKIIPCANGESSRELLTRVKKLADFSLTNGLPKLKTLLTSYQKRQSLKKEEKFENLQKKVEKFESLDRDDKMEMLEVDELGFWAFSACCFTGKLIILTVYCRFYS
jgi:hypothetical protein